MVLPSVNLRYIPSSCFESTPHRNLSLTPVSDVRLSGKPARGPGTPEIARVFIQEPYFTLTVKEQVLAFQGTPGKCHCPRGRTSRGHFKGAHRTPKGTEKPYLIIIGFWKKLPNPFENPCLLPSDHPSSTTRPRGDYSSGNPRAVPSWSVIYVPSQNNYLENIGKSQYNEKLSLVSFSKFFSSVTQLPESLRGL